MVHEISHMDIEVEMTRQLYVEVKDCINKQHEWELQQLKSNVTERYCVIF
jgi:hypothetical protein